MSTARHRRSETESTAAARRIPRRRTWTVYAVTETATGRRYVGRTDRPAGERFLLHWYRSGARLARFRPGSLAEVMRAVRDAGLTLRDSFAVEILETAASEDAAEVAERDWIAHFDSFAPRGFNLPAGSMAAAGPPRRAVIALRLRDGSRLTFDSVAAAHAWCAKFASKGHRQDGTTPPGPDVPMPSLRLVHTRLGMGWRPEEAFGLQPHSDLRGTRRTPLRAGGRRVTRIRDARGTWRASTLRSRAHRARRAGVQATADLLLDRRRGDAPRAAPRVVALPHPDSPDGPRTLGGRAFARAASMHPETVLNRLRGLERDGRGLASMSGHDLVGHLRQGPQDRRRVIRVELPDGGVLAGGYRELARRVSGDPALTSARAEILSEEGLRGRLRCLPAEPSNADLLRALGLLRRAGLPSPGCP